MFSKFFINRPIFSTVLAIIMVLAGLVTVKSLPVAQFPDITPPTVQVTATYPGADAKTVAEVVGAPIEEAVNGVEDMLYMSSNSGSDGSYFLTVTFKNGVDLDMATVKVQNRVAEAQASLPNSVQEQGVDVTSRSTNIIMFIALENEKGYDYSSLYLTNYAKLHMSDDLARVDGVGEVEAFGASDYSMRVWLDPEKMRVRGLNPSDVAAAIRSQNMEVEGGAIGEGPDSGDNAFEYTLTAKGLLISPDDFGDIIIRSDPQTGGVLHLRDVATVDLGSETYGMFSAVNGNNVGVIGIYQLPGANALKVAEGVQDELKRLEAYFPEGVKARVIMNSTDFVTASIDDVLVTFCETTLIVMIVIMIFLQNWRAVIIPMLTIPVSLIATFAVMKAMGFSLNTLTLFGLVLAIAIVVDDAIVVVEDCARIVSKGILSPKDAAMKAMRELQGPVIGEVLVLLSVFIPTAFISGITGQLYKQFALTIAVSTAFSGFNALTFTPAMCALFLKKKTAPKREFFFFRWFNKGWNVTLKAYTDIVGRFLRRPVVALGIYAALCLVAFWGFIKWPTSYVPQEDLGYFMCSVQLPTGASIERTQKVVDEVTERLMKYDEIETVQSVTGMSFIAGGSGSNYGSFFVMLKPWDERKAKDQKAEAVIDRIDAEMAGLQEAVVFAINPPAIPGLGMTSGLQMQLLDINDLGAAGLEDALGIIQDAAAKDSRIKKITSLYEGNVPQYSLDINREMVRMQGISMEDIYSALAAYTGTEYVNDFVDFGRTYQVNLRAKSGSRSTPDDVLRLSVRNADGSMVPFAAFAKIKPTMGQPSVSRYNMYTTASLTATPADGVSSSEGIAAMEEIVEENLGKNYSYAWTGEAYQETQAGTTITTVLIFAIIITLLVLAAQYESWTDPIAVILAMPTAILGTILGVFFLKQDISIYTQIGIILLLGLAAKNAILIVEYAVDFRKAGLDIKQAAQRAGYIRFRPIMMTALAFVFGVMPMLFADGAGAASQKSLGCAVVFGMAVNAFVGTLFVPNFWAMMEKLRERFGGKVRTGSGPSPVDEDDMGDGNDSAGADSGGGDGGGSLPPSGSETDGGNADSGDAPAQPPSTASI